MARNYYRTFLWVSIFTFYGVQGYCQDGLFMKSEDFKKGNVTNPDTLNSGNLKINLNDFWGPSRYLTLKFNHKKQRILKSSVFGYCDAQKRAYRLYKNNNYRILESDSVYIYSKERVIGANKGTKIVTDFYFSVGSDSRILPLSRENIFAEFSHNAKFIDLLETFNGDIAAYNTFHGTFAINYLYKKYLMSSIKMEARAQI